MYIERSDSRAKMHAPSRTTAHLMRRDSRTAVREYICTWWGSTSTGGTQDERANVLSRYTQNPKVSGAYGMATRLYPLQTNWNPISAINRLTCRAHVPAPGADGV